MKRQKSTQKIWVTRRNGEVLGYARHNLKREAQAIILGDVVTEPCDHEDLLRIGREGLEIKGQLPDIDPNQLDMPLPEP